MAVEATPPPDWIFAYGSLIWNPEFEYEQAVLARVHGYHRAFCIASVHYRGTPERPGIVLGLDRGGSCTGVAFRLAPHARNAILAKVHAREMLGDVYRPVATQISLADGGRARALTFVANSRSPDYLRLTDAEILQRLRDCAGSRGHNRDYAVSTWQALRQRGIQDHRLASLVGALSGDTPTIVRISSR